MRVLLTGADGYIGAIMGPKLIEAGHEVTGLDTGFYRRGWLFDDGRTHPLVVSKDQRDITVGRPARLRRGGAPRRALQRPDRRERPRAHHGDQPRGLGGARPQGARGRGQALRLGLLLLDLRRRRRRDAHRDHRARAADRLCPLQDPGRGGRARADGRALHPGLPAQRHRLRREPAAALRPGAEQPLRLRPHHRRDPDDHRRLALAADHPYRGHLPGDALRARRRPRGGGRRGVQRRRRQRELPGARDRRDRRARPSPAASSRSASPAATPAATG